MKALLNLGFETRFSNLLFLVLVVAGAWLRLDQYLLQVLLDDEWHVIHQLLVKSPGELFFSFGHADFSIPLSLLYWLELKSIGLSELGMRWPMLLAGLAGLVVFPLYVRRFVGDRAALIFSGLLAISPMLVIYSRTARPYALTLLFSLMALGLINRLIESKTPSWQLGTAYLLCAVTSVWLHLVSLPVVVAPFLVYGIAALKNHDWVKIRRLLWLGIGTLIVMCLLVLPPLLTHPQDLSVKLGVQTPDMQTYQGMLYTWFGTSSSLVVFFSVILSLLGIGPLWKRLPITSSLVAGLFLTLGIVLLAQPAWVNHSLTFARYLLAAIPLLLLAMALGLVRISDWLILKWGTPGKTLWLVLIFSGLLLMGYDSPLHRILAQPNSNSLHSVYQFDFRDDHNLVLKYQKDFPISAFWPLLGSLPADSLKIAVAPFSFETTHWDAARWEQISQQRVMPAYLNDFCTKNRWGEVPLDNDFKFRNVAHLSDQNSLKTKGFDLVVFQKPFKVMTYQGEKEFGIDTMTCESALREWFPAVVFEDQWLVVFPLSEDAREQINAAR